MEPAGAVSPAGQLPALSKYDLLEEIGRGGMAVVYRARDRRLGRDVAIKLIHAHLRNSAEVAFRFDVEAKAVAKLRHPNIVEVFDISSDGEAYRYLVVELVRGESLREWFQRCGPLPPELAACIGVELLKALAHAHAQGVIHRDIKPENVLVEYRPRGAALPELGAPRAHVKLTDFGIAKLIDTQGVTSTGQVLGSPAHMAPEQIEGGAVDERADIFAVGVLLYEAMVGRLPFTGANPAQVLRRVLDGAYPPAERERPTVGRFWSEIVDRALARDAAARWPSALAMREALERELARFAITSPREEIEAFCDAPERYAEQHGERIVAVSRTCAAHARAAKDVVAAGAHVNRALAHAPHDPRLLREVAALHRARGRAAVVKRVACGAAIVAAVASVVVAADRLYVYAHTARRQSGAPNDVGSRNAAGESSASARAATLAAAPAAASPAATGDGRAALRKAAAKAVQRELTIRSVRPPFGVRLEVDGQPAMAVDVGMHVALDARAHTLHFTCMNDACEPSRHTVPAGAEDAELSVSMSIKPAVLVVDGARAATYRITEEPTIGVLPGVAVRVPMRGSKVSVHVMELPSNRTERVTLTAGVETRVRFPDDGP